IEREARLEKRELPPGENWRVLQRLAQTLRKATILAAQATVESYRPWDARINDLKHCLREVEEAADHVRKYEVMKGAPRISAARFAAVWEARILLEKYGRPPTLYREGPWHNLARVLLFGKPEGDLFDYMKMQHQLAERQIVGWRLV